MRHAAFHSMLSALHEAQSGIEASAILSIDGLTLASLLPEAMDTRRQGTMRAAAMLNLGHEAVRQFACGDLEHVCVHGRDGHALLVSIGGDAVMLLLTTPDAPWAEILARVDAMTLRGAA